MAKNTNNNKKTNASKTNVKDAITDAKDTRSRTRRSGKRRNPASDATIPSAYGANTKMDSPQMGKSNALLSQATVESPSSVSRSLVFATDSAAMQAMGNMITTPGQDNFIENFNQVAHEPGISDHPLFIHAQPFAKRTANAMRLDILPYFGSLNADKSFTWMSPIMLAATNLKQFIDTSFGTNTNYSPQDLTIYLMGIAALFTEFAEIKRDLRLALTVQQNVYPNFVPQGLFALLGITDGDGNYSKGEGALYTAWHLRSLIDQLNQLILAFNRLPMPPELGVLGYNDDFFDHVFMDTNDPQTAQLYIFRNSHYWIYSEELMDAGPCVQPLVHPEHTTIQARINLLGQMLDRISNLRTDSTAMLQNLFNAYGSKDTLQLSTLDINLLQPLDFVYDPNMLIAIENASMCPSDTMTVSAIVGDAAQQTINGHIWVSNPERPEIFFNLPLQFHKPYETITRDDIGWALRLHPCFMNQRVFNAYLPGNTVPSQVSAVTCDGYSGFAYLVQFSIASISDDGSISYTTFARRQMPSDDTFNLTLDFTAVPIFVSYESELIGNESHVTLTSYSAKRDVELTYRLEDMSMHWTYLTQALWASNLNRNVSGSRLKG